MANTVKPIEHDQQHNLHQRLNAVMRQVEYIQKDKKSGMKYSIVSHDKVTGIVRPAFVEHGIVVHPHSMVLRQSGNRTEVELLVRFTNIDDRNDFIDVPSPGYGIDDQDKGPGKAISYAVKYAILKTLQLESGDEPRIVEGDDETDEKQDIRHSNDVELEFQRKIDAAETSEDLTTLGAEVRDAYVQKRINKVQSQALGQAMLAHAKELGIKLPHKKAA